MFANNDDEFRFDTDSITGSEGESENVVVEDEIDDTDDSTSSNSSEDIVSSMFAI